MIYLIILKDLFSLYELYLNIVTFEFFISSSLGRCIVRQSLAHRSGVDTRHFSS